MSNILHKLFFNIKNINCIHYVRDNVYIYYINIYIYININIYIYIAIYKCINKKYIYICKYDIKKIM